MKTRTLAFAAVLALALAVLILVVAADVDKVGYAGALGPVIGVAIGGGLP